MRRILAIVVWLAAVQSALAADSPSSAACGFAGRAQNALEERLFRDAADGRLDDFSPLGAALVASGVQDDDTLRHYEQKAAALVDELRRRATAHGVCLLRSGTPRQRVEAIFAFMHQRILSGGYDLAYTDLRRVLDEGRFNCISASVLFNYLAGQFGLDCRGLEMPGHAMSRVMLPDGPLDIETTCPQWFHVAGTLRVPPSNVVGTLRVPSNVAGTRRVPDPHTECADYRRADYNEGPHTACAEYKQAREVTPIQMAAMIYYNRGVDLLAEKRFAEAAAANAKALRLDPGNATARGNLLATINNWSIELGNSQHFAEAVDLLAARAGHRRQVRGRSPKTMSTSTANGSSISARRATSRKRWPSYRGQRLKCPTATISARLKAKSASAGRRRFPPPGSPAHPFYFRASETP